MYHINNNIIFKYILPTWCRSTWGVTKLLHLLRCKHHLKMFPIKKFHFDAHMACPLTPIQESNTYFLRKILLSISFHWSELNNILTIDVSIKGSVYPENLLPNFHTSFVYKWHSQKIHLKFLSSFQIQFWPSKHIHCHGYIWLNMLQYIFKLFIFLVIPENVKMLPNYFHSGTPIYTRC